MEITVSQVCNKAHVFMDIIFRTLQFLSTISITVAFLSKILFEVYTLSFILKTLVNTNYTAVLKFATNIT